MLAHLAKDTSLLEVTPMPTVCRIATAESVPLQSASHHASHPAGAPTGLICARLVAKGTIGEYLRSVRKYVGSTLSTVRLKFG